MVILDLLRSDGYIIVNKKLARSIGIDAAIMYSELISKEKYFSDREQLTDDGFFFNTVENMQEDTTLSKDKQLKAIKALVALGLIKRDNRGLPQKRYFKIVKDEENIKRVLQGQQLEDITTNRNRVTRQIDGVKIDSNNTKVNNPINNKLKNREQNSVIARYSFTDYRNSLNEQELTEHQGKQLRALNIFVDYHEEYREKEHPKLTIEQWKYAMDSMLYVTGPFNDDELTLDNEEEMISSYFQVKFKQGCNYSVLHYISGDLRSVRFYETIY